MEIEVIIGIHSVCSAIKNINRSDKKLFVTEETYDVLVNKKYISRKELDEVKVELLAGHMVQEKAKKYYKDLDLEYQRVPSNLFLVCSPLEEEALDDYIKNLDLNLNSRILCLDQITDVHNAGAIVRSASFYGVEAIIIPGRHTFSLTPSFYRIASGAAESVRLIHTNNLSRAITRLKENGVLCVGLSEHAKEKFEMSQSRSQTLCLVLGQEDVGISNAVLRNLDYTFALKSSGDIQSLNVSVAAAIAMEKCWGN